MKSLFLFLMLFTISSCGIGISKEEKPIVYQDFGNKDFFQATIYNESPYLENKSFYFPILSSKKIENFSNFHVFDFSNEVIANIKENKDNTRLDSIISDKCYLNLVNLSFNISNIDRLTIKRISFLADDIKVSLNVSINFKRTILNADYRFVGSGEEILESNINDCTFIYKYACTSYYESKFINVESLDNDVKIQSVSLSNGDRTRDDNYYDFKEYSNDGSNTSAYYYNLIKIKSDFSKKREKTVFFIDDYLITCSINGEICSLLIPSDNWTSLFDCYLLFAKEIDDQL